MAIDDNLLNIYSKLNYDRKQKTLYDRFPGSYRSVVVETNDPLNLHRIRYKCPEQHDFNLNAEDCPWAVSAFKHGGKGTGDWCAPKIGDIVWIIFEKQHPYGPIWSGHAEPTRRRYYRLHALFQKTQIYVDEEGKPIADDPIKYEEYYPKDGRPYSLGTKDRYGSIFVMDETGFYPSEHAITPSANGTDAIAQSSFAEQKSAPQSNAPDKKMMALISKYGHYMILGDQGYDWQSDFSGDFEKDHQLEKDRSNNLIRTLNEDEPDSANRDQRRIEFRSGYGHKFEMRDVGWAAAGPSGSSSRGNDWFAGGSTQSKFSARDERWLKLRTKGGHLLQFMDMGSNPASDVFIRRNRIDEVGGKADSEDDSWQGRDARQMRFVTRYGFKFVLDDRGSDSSNAEGLEVPRGNGWLLKGRRDNRGFGFDVNEKDQLNRSLLYTPKSKIIEMNDRFDYTIMCTDTSSQISRPWQKLKENEFATSIAMTFKPQDDTFHMKLDLANDFLRMKTPAVGGINQGFESRNQGQFNAIWTEMNDRDNRALILNSTKRFASLHDGRETKFLLINDNDNAILLRNKSGRTVIYSADNIEIKSDANIILDAGGAISMKAGSGISMSGGGGDFSVGGGGIGTSGTLSAAVVKAFHPGCDSGPGAGSPSPKPPSILPFTAPSQPPLTPTDRGALFNKPYNAVNENIITG